MAKRLFKKVTSTELYKKMLDAYNAFQMQQGEEGEEKTDSIEDIHRICIDSNLPRWTKELVKDLAKVEFDSENVGYETSSDDSKQILGIHTLENGLTFFGLYAGGDWEYPIYFILYIDDKDRLRAYLPTKGNPYNKDIATAFGNETAADKAYMTKTNKEWNTSSEDYMIVFNKKSDIPLDHEVFEMMDKPLEVLQDIEKRLVPTE